MINATHSSPSPQHPTTTTSSHQKPPILLTRTSTTNALKHPTMPYTLKHPRKTPSETRKDERNRSVHRNTPSNATIPGCRSPLAKSSEGSRVLWDCCEIWAQEREIESSHVEGILEGWRGSSESTVFEWGRYAGYQELNIFWRTEKHPALEVMKEG